MTPTKTIPLYSLAVVGFFALLGCTRPTPGAKTTVKAMCAGLSARACYDRGVALEESGDPTFFAHYQKACDKGERDACIVIIGRIEEKIKKRIYDDTKINQLQSMARALCGRGYTWACSIQHRIFSNDPKKRKAEHEAAFVYHRDRCSKGGVIECKEFMDLFTSRRYSGATTLQARKVEAYEVSCHRGLGTACYLLGYENWKKRRFDKGFALYERACSQGNALGCSSYVSAALNAVVEGLGNYRRNERGLSKLCEMGSPGACHLLARGHLKGWWEHSSSQKGAKLVTKECLDGDFDACNTLGLLYIKGEGIPKDLSKGRLLLTKNCADGQLKSCVTLAEALRTGLFGAKDTGSAANLLTDSCKSTYSRSNYSGRYRRRYYSSYYYYKSHACGMLGHYIVNKRSTAYSTYYGERFMSNACNMGYQRYCYLLAVYSHSLKRSSYYYLSKFKNACNKGFEEACVTLSDLYRKGDGLSASPSKAAMYRSKACRLNPRLKMCK